MDLRERIIEEIRASGPMPFSRFMELALYDEPDGFFTNAAPGPDGHFVTAPHVSASFIEAIAEGARRAEANLGQPFQIVDLGAGDGTLLAGLAETTGAECLGVDRSPAARASIRGRGLAAAERLAGEIQGLIVCNELFDNIPFDLAGPGGEPVLVVADDDALTASGDLATARPVPSEATRTCVAEIGAALVRGYALIIDYADPDEPVRGYQRQRPLSDVLAAPGESDITGPVDLDGIAGLAEEAGLEVQARTTQRELLHAFGFRRAQEDIAGRQRQARAGGDYVTEIALWNARGEAAMLVDPAGLGGYGVLVLATAGLPPLVG